MDHHHHPGGKGNSSNMEACQGDCGKCVRYAQRKREQKAASKNALRTDRAEWFCGICNVKYQERARPTHEKACAERAMQLNEARERRRAALPQLLSEIGRSGGTLTAGKMLQLARDNDMNINDFMTTLNQGEVDGKCRFELNVGGPANFDDAETEGEGLEEDNDDEFEADEDEEMQEEEH